MASELRRDRPGIEKHVVGQPARVEERVVLRRGLLDATGVAEHLGEQQPQPVVVGRRREGLSQRLDPVGAQRSLRCIHQRAIGASVQLYTTRKR